MEWTKILKAEDERIEELKAPIDGSWSDVRLDAYIAELWQDDPEFTSEEENILRSYWEELINEVE